jgi:hypothetical protein
MHSIESDLSESVRRLRKIYLKIFVLDERGIRSAQKAGLYMRSGRIQAGFRPNACGIRPESGLKPASNVPGIRLNVEFQEV